MKKSIYTVGYQGYNINEFIFYLKKKKISRIIDIRELPISRKKGFSKNSLKMELEKENIDYIHLKLLGSPKNIRDKLKKDYDYNFFFKEYKKYLNENIEILSELDNYLKDGLNCLMCYENKFEKCHRKVVAEKIAKNKDLTIMHIWTLETKKILITVKAYPNPSRKYQETVCSQGYYACFACSLAEFEYHFNKYFYNHKTGRAKNE